MTHTTEVPVFAWITGERTNVGDSLLRRPYGAALASIGPLHVWINCSGPDFLAGVGLPESARLYPRFALWYTHLITTALRGRTVLAVNAGESRAAPARAALFMLLGAAAILIRARGGSSVWVGGSIPPHETNASSRILSWAHHRFDLVQWRDRQGSSARRGRVGPDWAFAEGSDTDRWLPSTDRLLCAVVMRGDRPMPSAAWIEWLRGSVRILGLRPVVVVQVRQDDERARVLARALDAEVIGWDDADSHRDQEDRVRSIYGRSAIVVGDRLHGLVAGATEGAVPFGWVPSSGGKIARHFDVVGLETVGRHEGAPAHLLPAIGPSVLAEMRAPLADRITRARAQLDDVAAELAVFGRREETPPRSSRVRPWTPADHADHEGAR